MKNDYLKLHGQDNQELVEVESSHNGDEPWIWDPPFRIHTGPRSRRMYDIGYLEEDAMVSDLHHEFARVSRRGYWSFCLRFEGEEMDGAVGLDGWDRTVQIVATRHDERDGCPRSARRARGGWYEPARRGGSPSSTRSKLAKKVKRSEGIEVQEPLQLLQLPRPVEGRVLSQLTGEPDDCAQRVRDLAKRHGCRFSSGNWLFGGSSTSEGHGATEGSRSLAGQ